MRLDMERQIKRVSGLSFRFREGQHFHSREHTGHDITSVLDDPMIAPSRNDQLGSADDLFEIPVILWSDGIRNVVELVRTGRSEGKEVADFETPVAPSSCITYATSNSGV